MMRFCFLVLGLLMCWPAFGGVKVVVPAHDIARGTAITEADLTYGTLNGEVLNGIITSLDDVVGLEPRRTLRAGETLRSQDLRRPIVVTKGSTVTMTFAVPGIVLTATGKAMSQGGVGDIVTVQNPASFRQISCVVTGPGEVRAQSGGGLISNRFASSVP